MRESGCQSWWVSWPTHCDPPPLPAAQGHASCDHTTLLLNCYTKLKDVAKLDAFIQVGLPAVQACSACWVCEPLSVTVGELASCGSKVEHGQATCAACSGTVRTEGADCRGAAQVAWRAPSRGCHRALPVRTARYPSTLSAMPCGPLQGDGQMSRDALHFDIDTAIRVRRPAQAVLADRTAPQLPPTPVRNADRHAVLVGMPLPPAPEPASDPRPARPNASRRRCVDLPGTTSMPCMWRWRRGSGPPTWTFCWRTATGGCRHPLAHLTAAPTGLPSPLACHRSNFCG